MHFLVKALYNYAKNNAYKTKLLIHVFNVDKNEKSLRCTLMHIFDKLRQQEESFEKKMFFSLLITLFHASSSCTDEKKFKTRVLKCCCLV